MIFHCFPNIPDCYAEDIRPIVTKTIERYGNDEWKATVLTNEIHGHLGIYAVIGVKMGIKTLDFLGIKNGDLKIISSAGTVPPVSCLNDGLQVSTGATMGHGLIASPSTDTPRVRAICVTKNNSVIKIKLLPEIDERIQNDINEAIEKYGTSAEYWTCVRQLAIRYWYELDRDKIFEIQKQ